MIKIALTGVWGVHRLGTNYSGRALGPQ